MKWHPFRHGLQRLLVIGIGLLTATVAGAATEEDFLAVYTLIREKPLTQFPPAATALRQWILYPYLRYHYLKKYPERANDTQISEFLTQYADTPLAKPLRQRWLEQLAQHQHWSRYLKFYQSDDGKKRPALECYQLQAQLATGQKKSAPILETALNLWLIGKTQPTACNDLFKALKSAGALTADRYWQRLQLALANRNLELAAQLNPSVPTAKKGWLKRWQAMQLDPQEELTALLTGNAATLDANTQDLIVYGLERLARKDPEAAYLLQTRATAGLSAENQQKTSAWIALKAAQQHHPAAAKWLANIAVTDRSAELQQWAVLSALRQQDWATAAQALDQLDPSQQASEQWQYWRARIQQQNGKPTAATPLLQTLAQQTSYYGFLAADQLGQAYRFNHTALSASPAELSQLQQNPAIARAKALLELGLKAEARGEWHYAMQAMTPNQLKVMAVLAQTWDWPDQAIVSSAKARDFGDLALRFPLAHQQTILTLAEKYQLDPTWVYGITRTESTFTEDIRSAVGAVGLMQLLPSTAQDMAKKHRLEFKPAQLVVPEKNIELGSAYLRYVLDTFNGNLVLATAAYNAGPTRSKRWQTALPADIWADTIPFTETRDYVQRVMTYSTLYAYRLQRPIMPLSQRMAAIQPKE